MTLPGNCNTAIEIMDVGCRAEIMRSCAQHRRESMSMLTSPSPEACPQLKLGAQPATTASEDELVGRSSSGPAGAKANEFGQFTMSSDPSSPSIPSPPEASEQWLMHVEAPVAEHLVHDEAHSRWEGGRRPACTRSL